MKGMRLMLSEKKCLICKYLITEGSLWEHKCKAYPNGIPKEIYENNDQNKNCQSKVCNFEYRTDKPKDLV